MSTNYTRAWQGLLVLSVILGAALADFGEFGPHPNPFVWLVNSATTLSAIIALVLIIVTTLSSLNYRRKLLCFGIFAVVASELSHFWMTDRAALVAFPVILTTILGSIATLWPRHRRPRWLNSAFGEDRVEKDLEDSPITAKADSSSGQQPTPDDDPTIALNEAAVASTSFLDTYRSQTFSPASRKHWMISLVVPLLAMVGLIWVLSPSSILSQHLQITGDLGGHVQYTWWSATHLIPHGHLTGWYPYNYNGLPLYTFYFPMPAVFVAIAHLFFSIPVAFKLVVAGSIVLIPLAGWIFAWAAFEKPSVAASTSICLTFFVASASYTSWGGTILTTFQGEYSYAWGLVFGMISLGLGIRAIRKRRGAPMVIVFLAITLLCHIVVFTAIAGTLTLVVLISCAAHLLKPRLPRFKAALAHFDSFENLTTWSALRYAIILGAVCLGITAFWWYPAANWTELTSSHGFHQVTVVQWLGRWLHGTNAILLPLSAFGSITLIWRKSTAVLAGLAMLVVAVIGALSFPSISTIDPGHALPIFCYAAALLAGIGIVELFRIIRAALTRIHRLSSTSPTWVLGITTVLVLATVALPMANSDYTPVKADHAGAVGSFGGKGPGLDESQYSAIVKTMQTVGRQKGCGNTAFESTDAVLSYGGSYALSVMPYWTNGCISALTGLLTESSATALYSQYTIFIMSAQPAIPALPPGPITPSYDFTKAATQLQELGVKYVVTYSAQSAKQARHYPGLEQVAVVPRTGPHNTPQNSQWRIFEFKHSATVSALSYSPAVYTGKLTYRTAGINWWSQQSNYSTVLARSGPQSWPRTSSDIKLPHKPLPSQHISAVNVQPDSVSFHVSKLGVPVQVRVSYFPNWTAGTTGQIYQATPNMMIVVPTSHNVKMVYGSAPPVVFATVVSWATLVISIIAWIYFAIRRKLQRGQTTAEVAPE